MKRHWVIALLIAGLCTACDRSDALLRHTAGMGQRQSEQVTTEDLLAQIRSLDRFYATEYRAHKVVTIDDLKELQKGVFGRYFSQFFSWGDRNIAIPFDVSLQTYIDFQYLDTHNLEVDGRHLRIILPDPHLVANTIDVDKKGIRQQVGFFRSNFSEREMTEFIQQGTACVIASAPQMGIFQQSRKNAAAVLVPLLVGCGYEEENIEVSFRKEYTVNDIPQLYDNEGSVAKIN